MRPANSSAAVYVPGQPPSDPAQIPRFLQEELAKISAVIALAAEGFDPVTYVAPAKPRKGMRRYADGVSWDAGAGEGLYSFDGATWNKL